MHTTNLEQQAPLLIARHLATRYMHEERAQSPDPGVHRWTPPSYPAGVEHHCPTGLVALFAKRILWALKTRRLTIRSCWRATIEQNTPNQGTVRPGKGDFVLKKGPTTPGMPRVLSVGAIVALQGRLAFIHEDLPKEKEDRSTWIAGSRFAFASDSDHALVEDPWRGGIANMRLPDLRKTPETHAVPLVDVAEPALVDHE